MDRQTTVCTTDMPVNFCRKVLHVVQTDLFRNDYHHILFLDSKFVFILQKHNEQLKAELKHKHMMNMRNWPLTTLSCIMEVSFQLTSVSTNDSDARQVCGDLMKLSGFVTQILKEPIFKYEQRGRRAGLLSSSLCVSGVEHLYSDRGASIKLDSDTQLISYDSLLHVGLSSSPSTQRSALSIGQKGNFTGQSSPKLKTSNLMFRTC